MSGSPSQSGIKKTLLVAGLLPVVASTIVHLFLSDRRWVHIPLHSLMEALGVFAALTLATLLLWPRRHDQGGEHRTWIASALLGMGILEGFHGALSPGDAFVWLRSTSTLVGGSLFALVWLPDRLARSRLANALPGVVALAAVVVGSLSVALPTAVPTMVSHGVFTPTAKAINFVGGLFFLAATVRFLGGYRSKPSMDQLLFARLCLLFGSAALLFPFSLLWNADWWFWHLLRLTAYLIVLGYAFVLYQRAAETLQASERKFRDLVECSPDGIVGVDARGRIALVNAQVERLFGYSRDELLGQSVEILLPERFRRPHVGHRAGYLTSPRARPMGACGMNLCGCRRDGSEFPVDVSLSPIETEEGLLITAVVRDISERKRAEQEINRLFTLSLDLLCVAGFDGYFKRLNPAWEKTLGFTTADLLEKPYREFIHPEDRPATLAEADKLAQGASVISFENRYRCKDGSYRWLQWTAYPVSEENLIYAAARDISERKRAEETLKALNRALELRTEELTAVNKELEAFTYSVSHDLRAPLRHVDGFSKILLEEFGPRLDPAAQHNLLRIREATQHMGRLVDDLLNLARVGRQELKQQVTGLNSLVEEVLADLKPETHGRQIEWQIGQLPFADCDPGLVKQVFSNLLSNAVKFTRPRTPALIQVGQTMVNGQPAVFVRDNGVGFSMKYADKLFGVFQRLHRREDFEGTGVGLATVQRILHKHGGRVWAEAELDQGATFYFTLGTAETVGAEKRTPAVVGEGM